MATQVRRPVQVSLPEEQWQRLTALGQQRGVPVTELIAQSIVALLRDVPPINATTATPTETDHDPIRSLIGIFDSGATDLGSDHDRYIAEYIDEENRLWQLKSS